jgi:hypothetical protein
MATRVSVTGGNYSDASTWQTITRESAFGSSTVAVTTAKRYTDVFTAPDTTSKCLGGAFYINTVSISRTNDVTVALEEYNGSAWVEVATKVINESNLEYLLSATTTQAPSLLSRVFWKFATPYQFTTTTAGYYRFSVVCNSSSAISFRHDGNTSRPYYIAVDDRTSAVTSSDDLMIMGDPEGAESIVIPDVDFTCGSAKNLTAIASALNSDNALMCFHSGGIQFPTNANRSITINGHLVVSGGIYKQGTRTNPIESGYKAQTIFAGNTIANNPTFLSWNFGSKNNLSFVGQEVVRKSLYTSGSGTTVSPLVTTSVTDWNVDDEIVIAGDVWNQYEIKFIRTKIDDQTYTLSDTRGGAESGFTNAHSTTNPIIMVTRNSVIRSADVLLPWSSNLYSSLESTNNFYYTELRDMGGSSSGRTGMIVNSSSNYTCNIEGCSVVPHATNSWGLWSYSSAKPNLVIKDIVGYFPSTTSTISHLIRCTNSGGTISNICVIGGRTTSVYLAGTSNEIDNICVWNGCSSSGSVGYQAAGIFANGTFNTFNNLSVQGCRSNAIDVSTSTLNVVKNSNFGNLASNVRAINVGFIGSSSATLFDNCDFGTDILWSGGSLDSENTSIYLNVPGSYIKFTNVEGNTNDNRNYLPEGDIFSDLDEGTSAGYPMRFRPQTGESNLRFTQKIPTGDIQNKTMSVGVFVKVDSANYWAGTYVMPKLVVNYDNGTTVSVSASKTAGEYQLLQIPFTPLTNYGQITVSIYGASNAVGADAYFRVKNWSILYPAGVQLDLGKQTVWAEALPLTPTIATNLSPLDVWAVSKTGMGAGTTGEALVKTDSKTNLIVATL